MSKLVLLSGGFDSATAAREAKAEVALFVHYGHPAGDMEAFAAARVCAALALDLIFCRVTNFYVDLGEGIIPARNAMLISLAISVARQAGCDTIVHGATRSDHDRFNDCRRPFFDLMREIAAPWGIKIETPLIDLSRKAVESLGFAKHLTWSCYTPGPEPCGICLSCQQ